MTETVEVGKVIPNFTATTGTGATVSPATLKGRNVVLYFYPKDNTPGCTQEGHDFNGLLKQFTKHNTLVYGVSRDTAKCHEGFRAKQGYEFELISDPDEVLCALFNVIRNKNMYGKQVRGIERSTFLIDAKGVLRREWRKVKVDGHAEEVLGAVSELQATTR